MTTVHYTGSQSDPAQSEALILELSVCTKRMDWCSIDVDDADADLDGIILQPANKLEPIPFLFDADDIIDCITLAAELPHRQERGAR